MSDNDREILTDKELKNLRDIHLKKILLSDYILVFNKNKYIGNASKIEIKFAKNHNKKIKYLEEENERRN